MPSRGAMLPSEEDDLQVQVVPALLRKDGFEVSLRSLDVGPVGKSPASSKPVDVGVNREGGHTEGLSHDHACGLVAHAREGFQRFEAGRDLTVMVLKKHLREPLDVLGLRWCETNVADEGLDVIHVQGGHGRLGRG